MDFDLSKRQEQQLRLILKGYGKALIWVKNGHSRLLIPDEVYEITETTKVLKNSLGI